LLFVRDSQKTTIGSGGYLRSLQIAELVVAAGHRMVDLPQRYPRAGNPAARWERRRAFVPIARDPAYGASHKRSRNKVTASKYRQTLAVIDDQADAGGLIWEFTQHHGALAAARARNLPVTAVAHNIESLLPDETLMYADGGQHERFAAECAHLKLADRRVVISARDQWLLSLFGIDAMVLPYYPPRERLQALQGVRLERWPAAGRTRLLVMGSGFYPPNYQGMRHILRLLAASGITESKVRVEVMGFGTERLEKECAAAGIVFHGSVSDRAMFDVMRQADAAVIYQHAGTGALTRIPELLIAGVPVLANDTAARGYEHSPGVQIFADTAELIARIEALDPSSPAPAFPYPWRAAQQFVEYLGGDRVSLAAGAGA